MISMNTQVNLDTAAIQRKADAANKAAQMQLDNDVLKDSNYYIPEDSGEAKKSGVRHTVAGSGQVTWKTPYIRRIYYNPKYNFSKDRNPNARGLWFEFAKAIRMPNWLAETKKKYFEHFNGK